MEVTYIWPPWLSESHHPRSGDDWDLLWTGRGQYQSGRKRSGVQGAHLNPLGLFLRTSIPFILVWRILSAFLPA
jgi:hypothetical protein